MATEDQIYNRIQAGIVIIVAGLVVFLLMRNYFGPHAATSFYFLSRDGLRAKGLPERIASMTAPSELQLLRITDKRTNVVGWIVTTNLSGASRTQWFACTVSIDRSRQPYVTHTRVAETEAEILEAIKVKPIEKR